MYSQKSYSNSLFAVVIALITMLSNSCMKDTDSQQGNPVQKNNQVKIARILAGIPTYEGNSPPNIEGSFLSTPMVFYKGYGYPSNMIGQSLHTIYNLYNQTTDGKIRLSEQMNDDIFIDTECFITGSGQNFTVWLEVQGLRGEQLANVFSGTYDTITGNFTNCYIVFVFTHGFSDEYSNHAAGDWIAARGTILSLNSIVGKWSRDRIDENGEWLKWQWEFFIDGTWNETAKGFDGSIHLTSSGSWSVIADSLTIHEPANIYNGNMAITKTGTYSVATFELTLNTGMGAWGGTWGRVIDYF
jgi:hypothetical protein